MRQRRKQPGQTRRDILAAAGAEFARHGYAGCGIAGIVEAAGLTKGALFHHFADKPSLASAWVDEVLAGGIREQWIEPLAAVDSLMALKRLCRERLEMSDANGPTLLLAVLSADLSRQGGDLAVRLGAVFSSLRAAIAGALDRGREDGWIYPSVKPSGEAALLVALLSGALLQAGADSGPGVLQTCATAMEDYLDTLRNTPP